MFTDRESHPVGRRGRSRAPSRIHLGVSGALAFLGRPPADP